MKREVKIGIYAVVIILAAWAGIRFLSGVDIFGRNATYYAYYDEVNGLQSAAPVMIKGVKIGQVTAVNVSPEDPTNVEVVFSVARQYKLPVGTEARLVSTSIMGGEGIEIVLGRGEVLHKSGDTLVSTCEADLMASLESVKDKVVGLVDNLNATLTGINSLVGSNDRNITEAIAHLNSVMKGLDGAIGGDTNRLSEIVAGINAFTTALQNNASRIDSIMANVDTVTTDLAAGGAIKSLSDALTELNTALARINSGEGSVGKLIGDEQLYANLTQASNNLSALLADLKENPKRYVHFSLFGATDAAEKEAAKAAKKEAKAAKKQAKADAAAK